MVKKSLLAVALLLVSSHSSYAVELGFSGMTQIDDNAFLVVQDKKVFDEGSRLGILRVDAEGQLAYTPLTVNDWKDADGRSSDLESTCRLPGDASQFLVAESGYWDGKFGRIFQLTLHGETAAVEQIYHVPKLVPGGKGIHGDNFEGMVCLPQGDKVLVILAERGGSSRYRHGYLRLGVLDSAKGSIDWQQLAAKTVEIKAPGHWQDKAKVRAISDLYLDKQGTLWAVATADAGDGGPFRSLVYPAAQVRMDGGDVQINPVKKPRASWVVDGFKVESLSAPAANIPDSVLSIGTEDEHYGGIWRPLFAPVE